MNDTVPPGLYCQINWSLTQVHQTILSWIVSVFKLSWVPGTNQMLGSGLMYRSEPGWSLLVPLWWNDLAWILRLSHQDGRKSVCGASTSFTNSRKTGSNWRWCSWCVPLCNFITTIIIHSVGGYTSKIFRFQGRSITSNRLVLNMVKGDHLQLRYCPPLFLISYGLKIPLSRRRWMSC